MSERATRAIRSRLDFSKIPTAIQIPNLIEVQRRSYERFLQMDKLPAGARRQRPAVRLHLRLPHLRLPQRLASSSSSTSPSATGSASAATSRVSTTCAPPAPTAAHMVITDPFHPGDVLCHFCGTYNKNTPDFCNKCGDPSACS